MSREDAKKYADECGLLHFEASAKDGTRVQAVFQEAARKLALSRCCRQEERADDSARDGQQSALHSRRLLFVILCVHCNRR